MLSTLIEIVRNDKNKINSRNRKAIRKRIVRDARPSEMVKLSHTIFLHEVSEGVHLYI